MARGWESKSVESQIESATASAKNRPDGSLSEAQIELLRKKETLILSRTRILHELDSATNPRYQAMLKLALSDLNAKLAQFKA